MFSDDVDARAVATGVATPGRELDLRVDGEVPQRFRVGMDARYEIPVTPPGPGRHDAHVVYADRATSHVACSSPVALAP